MRDLILEYFILYLRFNLYASKHTLTALIHHTNNNCSFKRKSVGKSKAVIEREHSHRERKKEFSMAPKLKTKTSADASPANATPPSPGGRNLRSSGRTLRSNSKGARLVSLEDNQMKYKMKNKGKKAYEGEDASGTIGSDAGVDAADPKGKGIKAEPEVGVSDAAGERDEDEDPVIVVEHWYFTHSLYSIFFVNGNFISNLNFLELTENGGFCINYFSNCFRFSCFCNNVCDITKNIMRFFSFNLFLC